MTAQKIDVDDMTCWVFRLAQKKWNISSDECAMLFKKYGLFAYIEECYDILHLSSYESVVSDLEDILKTNGITING